MRIYLDANILIAAFEDQTVLNKHVWRVVDAIEQGVIEAATSQITLAEVLPKPLSMNQTDLAQTYDHLLTSAGWFAVMLVTPDVLRLAARIRADRLATKLPDAIHLATAHQANCHAIFTGDKRLGVPEGLAIITPGADSLEQLRAITP